MPTAMPVALPTPTPAAAPASSGNTSPASSGNIAVSVTPNQARPGTQVTISGTGIAPFTPVSGITVGGILVLPSGAATSGPDGSFSATVILPALQPGAHVVNVSAGGDSGGASFTVLGEGATPASAPTPTPAPVGGAAPSSSGPIAAQLAPLAGKLDWVAHFSNVTKGWSVHDPSGTFLQSDLAANRGISDGSQVGSLTDLVSGEIYWFYLSADAEGAGALGVLREPGFEHDLPHFVRRPAGWSHRVSPLAPLAAEACTSSGYPAANTKAWAVRAGPLR